MIAIMTTDDINYINVVIQVTSIVKGSMKGCALTVHCHNDNYYYVMWRMDDNGTMIKHRLLASVTSYDRLLAHWSGFVDNAPYQ